MNPPLRIADLLDVNARFMRSAQLERDFEDPEALKGYIVTPEVSTHLQRLSRGFRSGSTARTWRITGDFGSGKSSFALLLAHLLARPSADLPKSLRPLRDELGLARSTPKLLPVLVTGSRDPLSMALVRALISAIRRGVDGRMRLSSRTRLESLLAAQTFSDTEAVTAIEQACSELVERSLFGGVLIILDEMGKFLEFAALHPEQQDVYFLQQLGESAARSAHAPLHIVGLLHQGFSAYADKLSETAQREWEKVADRYEEIVFAQPLSQVASLLAAALCVRTDSLRGWKSRTREDMATAVDLGLFGSAAGKTSLVHLAPELYPLHPTLLPVLTKFFRRFGQNERSLFSFLLSSEPHALQDFASRPASADSIYRLADFYDFAAHNFGHRLSGQSFRSHWNHIDAVVRSAANEDAVDLRILKTVGILNVIDAPELRPSVEVLALTLGSISDLQECLQRLCKRGILFNRGAGGYALWPHASVNLEQAILRATDSITKSQPVAEIVQRRLDTRPVVARKHYILSGNLRHFAVRFLTAQELQQATQIIDPIHPADGTLAVVLCETAAHRQMAEQAAAARGDSHQVLIAITKPLESLASLALELERWHWVERHTPELKDDRFAAEEVSRQIAASSALLENRITEFVGFRGNCGSANGLIWFHRGARVVKLEGDVSLQAFLSDLCDNVFQKAPEIRNELVNRHAISSAAAMARQKLFDLMLERAADSSLGIPADKAPPEKSMYLSVLRASKLHREIEGRWQIKLPEENADPCRVRPALEAIVRLLEKRPDARVPVDEIWKELRKPPLGVRDGLIPILLLAVFIIHETELAVYEDGRFQPEIEKFLMMRLVKAPQTFEFQLCRITGIRREVITQLAAVVEAEKAETAKILSIVRPLCLFVAELPEYARNTEALSPETLALRKAIIAAKEPADLIFSAIPKALGFESLDHASVDATKLAKRLSGSLTELRRAFPNLQARMMETTLQAFDEEAGAFLAWRSRIASMAETVLVGITEPELRSFSLKLFDDSNAESDWLEAMGALLTRVPPSRWSDREEIAFGERIRAMGGQFLRVWATHFREAAQGSESALRVALTRRTGDERIEVLQLSPHQIKLASDLREKLRIDLLTDRKASAAALTQLLWELLDDSK